MEGESLFNDASAIVLFQIFFGMVQKLNNGETPMDGGVVDQAKDILMKIFVLGGGAPFNSPTALLCERSLLPLTNHHAGLAWSGWGHAQALEPGREAAPDLVCWSAGGLLIGLAFGAATRLLLKLMHRKGHKVPEQLALTLAMAYLAFYIANAPCKRMWPP